MNCGMGARQEDLRPALLAADIIDIGADAVAGAERLARQALVAPDDRLAAAQIDDDVAVFDPLDRRRNDLADAVLVLVVLALALGIAHLLDDDLLGVLRGDAAEIDGRQRLGDEIADAAPPDCAWLRLVEGDLGGIVLDRLDHRSRRLRRVSPVLASISARMSFSAP